MPLVVMALPLLVVVVPLIPVPLVVACDMPVVAGPEVVLAAVVPAVPALPAVPVAAVVEVVVRPVVTPGGTPPSAKLQKPFTQVLAPPGTGEQSLSRAHVRYENPPVLGVQAGLPSKAAIVASLFTK